MRGTGYILQYSPSEQRGMIHLGGDDHSALLAFAYSDCDKNVRDHLQGGEIPKGSAIRVNFDVVLRDGGIRAISVRVGAQQSTGASKRTSKRRIPVRKKPLVPHKR